MDTKVQYWLDEIDAAKKREKDYRKKGKEILEIYDGTKKMPFNILYSNVETLQPAIVSNTPRPVVAPRFTTDDPLAMAASKAATHMLEYLVDTDHDKYEDFKSILKKATLDALLPGRGITAVKYDANIVGDDEDVDYEMICPDSKRWDRVYFGYATKWEKVPWVAYHEEINRDDAKKLFGDDIVSKIQFTEHDKDDDDADESKGKIETAWFYQVWDKASRKVLYVSEQYKDAFLKEVDDPLELSGFFNCPEPIRFVAKSSCLIPTPMFSLYENQAMELNKIQMRLNKVIDAIKVRGVYDASLGGDIEEILKGDDNEIFPTESNSLIVDKGGIKNSIWLMPIQELIMVARELYAARESCKQVIYEITGISDIIRGQSKASETLGAQQIKQAWGTMRIKNYQEEGQRYALDLIKIMLEIAVKNFSMDMWQKITNLPYPTNERRDKARALIEQGRKLNQPPPDNVLKDAQSPTWEEITELLKNDTLRMYRVDIETNSTLDVEATEDKALISEFMNAIAQFMNGISPMIEKGYMEFDVAKSMLLEVTRRYRFGRDVEDQIKSMTQPKGNQQEQLQQMQKQLEEKAKQIEQQEQQMEAERKKFEADISKENENLRDASNQLAQERMEFDMSIKLERDRMKMQETLAKEKQKLAEDRAEMEIERKIEEAQSKLRDEMKDNQRAMQSMLDSHKSAISQSSKEGEKQPITIVNEMPSQNKSVKFTSENGELTGAEISDG